MIDCITNSSILKASLEFVSDDDYGDIVKNEFKNMCLRFDLSESEMIALVTTHDISLLDTHYDTIWDSLNFYCMSCIDTYKKKYIETLYKTDFKDKRINALCDDLQKYIKNKSCINVDNDTCDTFVKACERNHDECVKYLLNEPQKHNLLNDGRDADFVDYICMCGGSVDIIKYLFEDLKKSCTTDAIDWASKNGHLDVITYLFEVQHKDCTTNAIIFASENGHLDVVTYLFEIHHKDCTYKAVDNASKNCHNDVVLYLTEEQNKIGKNYSYTKK